MGDVGAAAVANAVGDVGTLQVVGAVSCGCSGSGRCSG